MRLFFSNCQRRAEEVKEKEGKEEDIDDAEDARAGSVDRSIRRAFSF